MSEAQTDRKFPDWEQLYRDTEVREMPWYSVALDADLVAALAEHALTKGDFLDLGTGPGTQARELARLGFRVTGTDLSASAVAKARTLAPEVDFRQDDVLHSKLPSASFDFVFDRGCFHVLDPSARKHYVQTVARLLRPRGYLFLKTFSTRQEQDFGPHRFAEADILAIFEPTFALERARESVFEGTLPAMPHALFSVLRRR
jgi:SAM-dependent methyltransferase